MPVLDFFTLRVLVCGGGSPQRFAKMNLVALRKSGRKPLLPIPLYLSLLRKLHQQSILPALTDLASLRQDVELTEVSTNLLNDTELLHRANRHLDLLNCLSAATALKQNIPLAVMDPKLYSNIGTLQFAEWWKKP